MLELIADILDFTKIETGKLTLSIGRANLQHLTESIIKAFYNVAERKGISFTANIDPDANCDVMIDSVRFKQILTNLLSNAIKFTDSGEVNVFLSLSKSELSDRAIVQLRVEDTGIGISPEDQLNLFVPFMQGANNVQAERIGAGLGLVITKELIEMMGGELKITSLLGNGTNILVSFNLQLLTPVETESGGWVEGAGKSQDFHYIKPHSQGSTTVLVVDDYDVNRMVLTQQLSYLGCQFVEAKDGLQALALWRENNYTTVITDCSMPVMSGYELARAIRSEEDKDKPCFIIGTTANIQNDEHEKCIESGMNICLFKPIKLSDLHAIFTQTESEHSKDSFFLSMQKIKDLVHSEDIDELLEALLKANHEDLAQLDIVTHSTPQALSELKALAHRIKGGASLINANAIMFAAEELEMNCKDGKDGEAIAITKNKLIHAVQELNEYIENYINLKRSSVP